MPSTSSSRRYAYPPRPWTWIVAAYLLLFLLVWVFAQPYSIISQKRQALYADARELARKSRNGPVVLQALNIYCSLKDLRLWYEKILAGTSFIEQTVRYAWDIARTLWAYVDIWTNIPAAASTLGRQIFGFGGFLATVFGPAWKGLHWLCGGISVVWSFAAKKLEDSVDWSLAAKKLEVGWMWLVGLWGGISVIASLEATKLKAAWEVSDWRATIRWFSNFFAVQLQPLGEWPVNKAYEVNICFWAWLNRNPS